MTAESGELPGADLSGKELVMPVIPRQRDEFVCATCFLLQHRTRLAGTPATQPICVDSADCLPRRRNHLRPDRWGRCGRRRGGPPLPGRGGRRRRGSIRPRSGRGAARQMARAVPSGIGARCGGWGATSGRAPRAARAARTDRSSVATGSRSSTIHRLVGWRAVADRQSDPVRVGNKSGAWWWRW